MKADYHKRRNVTRQTSKTHKTLDSKRRARYPGIRFSKKRKVYYERRKNRSDKPGSKV